MYSLLEKEDYIICLFCLGIFLIVHYIKKNTDLLIIQPYEEQFKYDLY